MGMTKAALTPARKRFVELMQNLNFGRIYGLAVENGDPVLDHPPRVVREIKIGGDNNPRPELESVDFELTAKILDFFSHLDRLNNGTVEFIEVKHGLPFHMSVEEPILV